VTLVGVTKGVGVERIRVAMTVGLVELGENRVQEAAPKVAALAGAAPAVGPRWHMVGHLQSNKAARAVALFDELHSLDSLELAEKLDRVIADGARPTPLPVYVQVNVDADPAKAGFSAAELESSLDRLAGLRGLTLRGLMTIGRPVDRAADARPTFAALRLLSERLRRDQPALGAGLSMGMSDDFEVAAEEGATVVRIGRALFGERPAG
jgi:pyridoxal phosphate enzyme (YggS family)